MRFWFTLAAFALAALQATDATAQTQPAYYCDPLGVYSPPYRGNCPVPWRPVGPAPTAPQAPASQGPIPLVPQAPHPNSQPIATDDQAARVLYWIQDVEDKAALAPPWYAPKPPFKSRESAEQAANMLLIVVTAYSNALMSSTNNPADVYFSEALTFGAYTQMAASCETIALEYNDPIAAQRCRLDARKNAAQALRALAAAVREVKRQEGNH